MKQLFERLYLGTWQFSGQFKNFSDIQIKEIITFANSNGIRKFDTAAVYGNGKVESILGETMINDSTVLTKIPAVSKPSLETSARSIVYYPKEWINKCLLDSSKRLCRAPIDTILLHNWSRQWQKHDDLNPLMFLLESKAAGVVKKIGVSLPDDFDVRLSDEVIELIDVVEAPLNTDNTWILSEIPRLKTKGVEVILRSLFMQGLLIMDGDSFQMLNDRDIRKKRYSILSPSIRQNYKEILLRAWELQTSITVGMTTFQQILDNIACLGGI